MRSEKADKHKSMTVRMDASTETKFGIIWNILQSYEPPQIRLSRNDVFELMVKEYYQVLKKRESLALREYDTSRELE